MPELNLIKQVSRLMDIRKIGLLSIFLALVGVVFFFNVSSQMGKRGEINPINSLLNHKDFPSAKEFLLNRIKSPYTNITYTVERGDSINKILKKNDVSQAQINKFLAFSL